MKGLTLALLVISWTAVAAQPEQVGPFGLKWGMRPSEVRSAFKSRLGTPQVSKHAGAASSSLTFDRGTYEGLPIASVEAEFPCEELRRLTVTLPTSNTRPLYRVWKDVMAKMTAQYGAPAELEEPPSVQAARDQKSEPTSDAVLKDLRDNRGRLSAQWSFARDRMVTLAATVTNPVKGARQARIIWTFNDAGPEATRCVSQHFEH